MKKALLIFFAVLSTNLAFTQRYHLEKHWWEPIVAKINITVEDTVNGKVYVGGEFDRIASNAYFGTGVDTLGNVSYTFDYPNGAVWLSISDGNNGWYIGGDFTKVGDSIRNGIAHVDSLGKTSSKFSGKGIVGKIEAMTLNSGNLFLGGDIKSYGDLSLNNAILDTLQDTIETILPYINGSVYVSIPDDSGGWYIGGEFSKVGDQTRHNVAHITSNGKVGSWKPEVNGGVVALEKSGDTIFLAGNFSAIGVENRENIAAVNTIGALYPWNPSVDNITKIKVIGDKIVISGSFNVINGQSRNGLASFNISDGALTSWNPMVNGVVRTFDVYGDTVYLGGNFSSVGLQTRTNLAAVSLNTGQLSSWNPVLSSSSWIYDLLITNDQIYLGGSFISINGLTRHHLASVDLNTKVVSSWNPVAGTTIRTLDVIGDRIVVGGSFNNIGGQNQNRIALINQNTGVCKNWGMSVVSTLASNYSSANTLSVSNDKVFVGGEYITIGGIKKENMVIIDTATSEAVSWNHSFDDVVSDILVSGDTLYVGGAFENVDVDSSRNGLCAFQLSTQQLLPWDVNLTYVGGWEGKVLEIATSNDVLYINGYFDTIAGQPRTNFAAIHIPSNTVTSLNQNNSFSDIKAMEIVGDTMVVGGMFNTIGGQSRDYIAAINLSTNLITSWNPMVNDYVRSISIFGDKVYLCGNFTEIGGQERFYTGAVGLTSGVVLSWNPTVFESSSTIQASGKNIYVGGFNIGGVFRKNIVCYDINTGKPNSWNPSPNEEVLSIETSGSTVYVGGRFDTIGGQNRNIMAELDTILGTATTLNLSINGSSGTLGYVSKIRHIGNGIYFSGLFSSVNGQTRTNLAKIDQGTGVVQTWNPASITGPTLTYSMIEHGGNVLLGGYFNSMGGQSRNNLAAVDTSIGLADTWNPNFDLTIFSMVRIGNKLFVGGHFSTIGGVNRFRIAEIDLVSGLPTTWDCNLVGLSNARVVRLQTMGNKIFVNNQSSTIGGMLEGNLLAVDASTGKVDHRVYIERDNLNSLNVFGDKIYFGGTGQFDVSKERRWFGVLSKCYSESIDTVVVCDSLTWIDGITYTNSTDSATFRLTNAAGCDSIVTLNLTVNSNTGIDTHVECDSLVWIDGNTYYTSNNTAQWTLTNSLGCDSVVTLDLTVNSNTGIDTHVECDSLVWIDGTTYYTSNNMAQWTLTNAAGCDSIVTLDLTVNSNTGIDTIAVCDSLLWIDGNTYNASNNTAQWVLTNSQGCDSIVTLDLTILQSSFGIDSVVTCDSLVWLDGNTYYTSNNTAQWTLTNSLGCDSLVSLDLTIIQSDQETDSIVTCDSLVWLDGNTYYTSNNTAQWTLTNTQGCDSVITLDLTINQLSTGVDQHVVCDSLVWLDGNTYYTSNNTTQWTLTNSLGCDSVVTLDLTIYQVDTSTTLNLYTISSNAIGAQYQWLDCNNGMTAISGETGSSFTAEVSGNYAVEVTENGCVDTSSCIEVLGVGIIENTIDNKIKVYPNPTQGDVVVEFDQVQPHIIMNLYGVNGQLVQTQITKNSDKFEIKFEGVSGHYVLELLTPNEDKAVIHLIKE